MLGESHCDSWAYGFEDYAVDILQRLLDLGRKHGNVFHSTYNGYVVYRYRHDAHSTFLEVELTGSGETCACHVASCPG